MAIAIFVLFVIIVLSLSFYLAQRAKSASGYYAAGGKIHWSVNGIAFAGDYLSAASFLGICGMIATAGYDGFLYSIGYLAGWIVALFIVAEPMKRLGKYTFADALDQKFDSRGIKLAAAISTLIVSVFYLIPQMVGAGVLVEPLLGLPHYAGVIIVGAIVITIVATAGMASTTYVQFLKGSLLIVFSIVLVVAVLIRGLSTTPDQGGKSPLPPSGNACRCPDGRRPCGGGCSVYVRSDRRQWGECLRRACQGGCHLLVEAERCYRWRGHPDRDTMAECRSGWCGVDQWRARVFGQSASHDRQPGDNRREDR